MEKRPPLSQPPTFHVEPRPDALLEVQLSDLQRLASLGVLAGAVLHEINNALTPALSYSQLALANPLDQALARKALERAVAGIRHATKIAESTLGLAMLSESATAERSPFSRLEGVLENTRTALAHTVEMAGVFLKFESPTGLCAGMHPLELQQVLVNLVTNSIRACTRGGEIKIRCSTRNNAVNPGGVEIEVVDDGAGVCDQVRSRLFQPLASGAVGGHGLGLMASRQLVEAAGGTLEFDGAYTPGARFVIRLS